MTTPPLSPAAQAVLDAAEQVPVPHGQAFPLIRLEIAAAIRALAEQVVPEETWLTSDETCYADYRKGQETRAEILAIAAELHGGAGAPAGAS